MCFFLPAPFLGDKCAEYVPPRIEVAFQAYAYALRGDGRFGEVAVVGFAVGFQAYVSAGGEQPLHVEIADEIACCGGIVAIAEVSIDEQAVVQQASRKQAFHVHVAPTHFAGAEVGADIPIAVVPEYVGEHLVELPAQGGGEQRFHGHGRLALFRVVIVIRVEAADAEKVNHLHVFFFFGADAMPDTGARWNCIKSFVAFSLEELACGTRACSIS